MGLPRPIRTVVIIIAFLLLVAVPLAFAWQSTGRQECEYSATPTDVGVTVYEKVNLTARDGVMLSAWLLPAEGGRLNVTVILMHGYTSCKAHPQLLELAATLTRMGANVILFDFRAHGESGGERTSIGPRETLDALAAIDYASRTLPGNRIVLVGFSMGGAVAYVVGASDSRVQAIVADSPYYRLENVVPRWIGAYTPLPAAYGRLIGLYGALLAGGDLGFGPGSVNPPVNKPVTIIYGDKDPLITPGEMKDLADKSPCGTAHEFKNTGHVEAVKYLGTQGYARIILETLDRPCPTQ